MKISSSSRRMASGFTLVELLIVIAIIAIMASIVISAFSNASSDSRLVLARQQQAVVQEAVNDWIASQSSVYTNPDGSKVVGSISKARTAYNGATTTLARLNLVTGYLDDATTANLTGTNSHTTNDQICSDVMYHTGSYLQITDWPTTAGAYPKVNLILPSSP